MLVKEYECKEEKDAILGEDLPVNWLKRSIDFIGYKIGETDECRRILILKQQKPVIKS